jgi:hypothetical protein
MTRTLDGAATTWKLGARSLITNGLLQIAAIQFGTATGTLYDNAFILSQINKGFLTGTVPSGKVLVGIAGTYSPTTKVIDRLDWIYYDTACTCAQSDFIKTSSTIRDMASTIVGGDLDTVTFPVFKLQHEQFGAGSCGPTTYTLS